MGRTRRYAMTAAALAVVAGTPLALGQSDLVGEMDRLEHGDLVGELGGNFEAHTQRQPRRANAQNDNVRVDDHMMVELHVRDEDLATVLQMLSMQSQRSIVTTQNVSANVTANLYGVTFYEALDAILLYNNYGYIERGDTIYVMPLQDIIELEQASRQRIHKVIKLNYLNAVDAATFAQPLLSDGGQISTNGQTAEFSIPSGMPTGADEFALEATLVIHDFEENIEEIRRLLNELDTRPAQVLVEATILQSQLTEANAFGVDFSIIADMNFSDFVDFGGPRRAVDALITGGREGADGAEIGDGLAGAFPPDGRGRAVTSSVGNTLASGGMKVGVVHNDVAVFLRMLDEVSDTTVLSNPKILALNRQPARVQVGRRVGYLSTTTTDTATSQTVEFLDTGTQLYFRPFITNEGLIRMELRPEVSQPFIREVTEAGGVAVTIPDEDTSHLVTNVLVRDGQTVVLGGLFTERTRASRRQVPVLGDIPLVGAAFRGHDDSVDRAEIIFMITPTIVNDEILLEQSERGMAYVRRARAGAREGLLPWSRERRSGQLVLDAERLAREGNTRKAMNRVKRALSLKPLQPDAIALRERLSGKTSEWPSRSVLEDIINNELGRRLESMPDQSSRADEPELPAPAAPLVETEQADATPEPEEWIEPTPEPEHEERVTQAEPSADVDEPAEEEEFIDDEPIVLVDEPQADIQPVEPRTASRPARPVREADVDPEAHAADLPTDTLDLPELSIATDPTIERIGPFSTGILSKDAVFHLYEWARWESGNGNMIGDFTADGVFDQSAPWELALELPVSPVPELADPTPLSEEQVRERFLSSVFLGLDDLFSTLSGPRLDDTYSNVPVNGRDQ